VGAPFFNMAFTPFMVLLGLVLPIGAMLPWKRAKLGKVVKPLVPAFVLALALGGLAWTIQGGRSLLGPVGLFLGAWLLMGAAIDLMSRTGRGSFGDRIGRLTRLPRADWGKAVAHTGFGVTIFGVAGMMAWEQEDIRVAHLDQPYMVGAYEITLEGVREAEGPNYLTTMGDIRVRKDGKDVAMLHPEKRVYPVAAMPTTEAAIDYRILRDVYLALGDAQPGGAYTVRTYIKPLANWIWGGCLLMSLGGLLSLTDRRYRVAAGARKTRIEGVAAE